MKAYNYDNRVTVSLTVKEANKLNDILVDYKAMTRKRRFRCIERNFLKRLRCRIKNHISVITNRTLG